MKLSQFRFHPIFYEKHNVDGSDCVEASRRYFWDVVELLLLRRPIKVGEGHPQKAACLRVILMRPTLPLDEVFGRKCDVDDCVKGYGFVCLFLVFYKIKTLAKCYTVTFYYL